MENFDVRLARIEERLRYVAGQLERLLIETEGLTVLKTEVMRQRGKLDSVYESVSHAKGMVVAISATVAFLASWLPEIIFKKFH